MEPGVGWLKAGIKMSQSQRVCVTPESVEPRANKCRAQRGGGGGNVTTLDEHGAACVGPVTCPGHGTRCQLLPLVPPSAQLATQGRVR